MTCPVCGNETIQRFRPFCCKRCADIDLGRWLRGNYALPSRDPEDAERAAEELGRNDPETH